ncbi:hypothetical protein HpDR86_15030 [Helicobacter pylori]
MLAGFVTGIFSIPLGMGGGILMVPFLGYFLKYDSKKNRAFGAIFCGVRFFIWGHLSL